MYPKPEGTNKAMETRDFEQKWITSKEAMEISGRSETMLRRLRNQGKLQSIVRPRAVFYLRSEIEELAKKRKRKRSDEDG